MKNQGCLLTLFFPSGAGAAADVPVTAQRPSASYPGFSKLLSPVSAMGTDIQGTYKSGKIQLCWQLKQNQVEVQVCSYLIFYIKDVENFLKAKRKD